MIRGSDIVALGAIALGGAASVGIVTAALPEIGAERHVVWVEQDASASAVFEEAQEALDADYEEVEVVVCAIEYEIDEDALVRPFLEEQLALQRLEARRMRTAAHGVRERVRAEMELTAAELGEGSPEATRVRQDLLAEAADDLVKMAQAEAMAERAMAAATADLESRLADLEIRTADIRNLELEAQKRHRTRPPPCKRHKKKHRHGGR